MRVKWAAGNVSEVRTEEFFFVLPNWPFFRLVCVFFTRGGGRQISYIIVCNDTSEVSHSLNDGAAMDSSSDLNPLPGQCICGHRASVSSVVVSVWVGDRARGLPFSDPLLLLLRAAAFLLTSLSHLKDLPPFFMSRHQPE